MRFTADFHIHSRFSRATSKEMDIPVLSGYAKRKGLNLLGTGDFTHPVWLKELEKYLKPNGNGLFQYNSIHFILTTEVCNIFYPKDTAKKIHNIIFSPSFESVHKINNKLMKYGELLSDGRPILSLSARDLVKMVLDIDPNCFIVPGHIWTPHFSLFGSNSGFNDIYECFGDMTKHIFALETGLSCYDEQTEVLTEDGWKKFSKVKYSDKICTLNLKTDEIEFQNPVRIFTYKYKGKMYRLKTKRVDLLVTPNHKLLYTPCDFRTPHPYILKEAESLFNRSKRFKKDGIWIGKNPEYFILPAVKIKHGSRYYSGLRVKKEKYIPVKPWLKFFGFWLAEGWVSKGNNGDYIVCVSNQDISLLNEMKQLLTSFGYHVYQGNNMTRVRDYQLFHYLSQFGKCYDKFIPSDVKSLSKEMLEILLQYYLKGDGHIYGRSGKGLSATTSSIRLRNDLQEIALKIGISAYYKLGQKKGTPVSSLHTRKIYRQRADTWVIYFIRRNRPIILPSKIKKYNYTESWVDYKGFVYCVAVLNHVVYIRRNGIPLWCGNSDPAMNWRWSKLDRFSLISNSDAHSPIKLGREANIFDTELDYFAIRDALRNKDKTKFLATIEFFPEEGKYHWNGHRLCNVNISPKESMLNNNLCPVCKRLLTVGVMHRVEELCDRPEGFIPENAIPYRNLVPLVEIMAQVYGKRPESDTIKDEFENMTSMVGTEMQILMDLPKDELRRKLPKELAEAILQVRNGKVEITPGYDGVYGKVEINMEHGQGRSLTMSQMQLW